METPGSDVVNDNIASGALFAPVVIADERIFHEDEDLNPMTADSSPPEVLHVLTDDRCYNTRRFQQAMQDSNFEPLKDFTATETTLVFPMKFLAAYPETQRKLQWVVTEAGGHKSIKKRRSRPWGFRIVEDVRDVSVEMSPL